MAIVTLSVFFSLTSVLVLSLLVKHL